jgi:site-specific DNA recombinase
VLGRGQIYSLLKCGTYVGEVHHRGNVYPGLHKAIIDRDVWDRVQAQIAANTNGHRSGVRSTNPGLLARKIVDASGGALYSSHATKGTTRYRYYVGRDFGDGRPVSSMRIPANEIEAAVRTRIGAIFDDGFALATTDWLQVSPSDYATLTDRCAQVAGRSRAMVRELLQQVRIHDNRIEIDCSTAAIAKALGVERDDDAPDTMTVVSDVRLTRSGNAMRLIHSNGAHAASLPSTSLIKLVIRARRWWNRLKVGDVDIKTLGKLEGVQDAYVTRVLRLAFLSPTVVDAILKGGTVPGVDGMSLTAAGAISPIWSEQAAAMLPAAVRQLPLGSTPSRF